MQITPEIIENKEFKKALRGYDAKDVDSFLDEVIEEMETLSQKNQKMKEEKDILLNQLAHYKKKENELNETLLKAQESVDNLLARTKAEYEAKMDVVKDDSPLRISNIERYEQGKQLEEKYNSLRQKYLRYRDAVKNDLRRQLDILEKDVLE